MKNGKFLTMGIESSCDETAVAVMSDGREVLSNVISSQIEIHKEFGGVVPEIASRHHLNNINAVVEAAMEEAEVTWDDIDLIGVTEGPGLIGALLVGVATAKAYAFAKGKPLIGVHHLQGHISANYVADKDLEPPFMALVVSGGHTGIVKVTDYCKCEVLGETRDDAAGEAFDKVARVLGLPYPGGPEIDKLAQKGNPHAVEFKRVWLGKDSLDFSFSGIKTGVLNYINTEKQAGRDICPADVASSFQQAVLDVLVDKATSAAVAAGMKKLVLAGGVAANAGLRAQLEARCRQLGITLYCPPIGLCTDNAAMIGCAAYYMYKNGEISDLEMDATATWPLGRPRES